MRQRRWAALILISFFFSACAHYHVTRLESFLPAEGSSGRQVETYAVTKNNMVIPELSVNRQGNYPLSRAEALQRLHERKQKLESFVAKKYETPNSMLFQTQRLLFGIGFSLVSPVAIPVMAMGRIGDENPKASGDSRGLIAMYFDMAFNSPVPQKPKIREEVSWIEDDILGGGGLAT